MDKVIKINSKEGGPFTTTSNLINFMALPMVLPLLNGAFLSLWANGIIKK